MKNSKGQKFSVILGRSFVFIVILTLMMGAINIVALKNTNEQYTDLIDNSIGLDLLAKNINADLLQIRRAEKDFIARNDPNARVIHNEYIDHLFNNIDLIVNLSIPQNSKDTALEIKELILIYQVQSDIVFESYIARGGGVFDPDKGLVGDMRDAIHNFETLLVKDYDTNEFNQSTYYYLEYYYNALRKDEKDYLLRDDIKYYNQAMDKIDILGETINQSLSNNTRIDEYNTLLEDYQTSFDALIASDEARANDIAIFTEAAHNVEVKVAILVSDAEQIESDTISKVEEGTAKIMNITYLLIFAVIAISAVIVVLVTRSITKPIASLNEAVSSIAGGDLSHTVEWENSSTFELNELNQDVNTMKASLNNLIRSIAEANNVLNTTSEDLLSGAEEINASSEEVASTSQAMSDGATSQTELISEVNENLNNLQNIVDGIVSKIQLNTQEVAQIALQTNILALNAGIEASRAGDYGRGFAVVAENVRKLSDQSKLASERIETVADEIKDTLQTAFNDISQTMINVVSVSEETAASAEEVAAAAEEMTATIEEFSSAAQELTSRASQSHELISHFNIEKNK